MTSTNYNDYKVYKSYNGYKGLPFYQQSEIIYDFTVEFCRLYVDPRSRTYDQMTQAGRSGKQNIAEGYLQRSVEGKLKLLAVSRGSLEELLKDYISSPETAANAMICLINQTNNLLDQKLRWLEEQFVKEGGFRENFLKKRLAYREGRTS